MKKTTFGRWAKLSLLPVGSVVSLLWQAEKTSAAGSIVSGRRRRNDHTVAEGTACSARSGRFRLNSSVTEGTAVSVRKRKMLLRLHLLLIVFDLRLRSRTLRRWPWPYRRRRRPWPSSVSIAVMSMNSP